MEPIRQRVLGIVGWKGNGKTTLVERLVAELSARGLSVSTIKHAHHDAEIDIPGTDTWRHRAAGAVEVVLATRQRWAIVHELREAPEPGLATLLGLLQPCDLVLVEGFKAERHVKIEVHRAVRETPLLAVSDPTIVAVVSDVPLTGLAVPVLDLDDTSGIAELVRLHAAPMHPPAPPLSAFA